MVFIDMVGDQHHHRKMSGNLFVDGSCSSNICTQANRAGWAVVQAHEGKLQKAIYGPVWHPLQQTSQMAEWLAWAISHQVAEADSVVFQDCENVVKGHYQPWDLRLRPTSPFAGIMRSTLSDWGSQFIKQVVKVKAHQQVSAMQEGEAKWQAQGNQWADHFAELGAKRHNQGFQPLLPELEADQADVGQAAKLVLRLWQLWPSLPRGAPKASRTLVPRVPRQVAGHNWCFGVGRWQCSACFAVSGSDLCKANRQRQVCQGISPLPQRALDLGHSLVIAHCQDQPLYFCKLCGAWATKKFVNLLAVCPRSPSSGGSIALKRLAAQVHPLGRGLPRMQPGFFDCKLSKLLELLEDHSGRQGLAGPSVTLPAQPEPVLSQAQLRMQAIKARLHSKAGSQEPPSSSSNGAL